MARPGLVIRTFTWAVCVLLATSGAFITPEQVHLSIGEDTSTIVVTWVTTNATRESVVKYGLDRLDNKQSGSQEVFIDGGSEQRSFYIHRVRIANLTAGLIYYYVCGCDSNWSPTFQFRALPNHANWSPRLAIFGDLGVENGRSLPELQRETIELESFDAIFHVGDFAYNMDSFMSQIESVASRVPYMTAVGNHELAYNFSNYRARFTMPGGDGQGQFYSFNLGPAHIIAFSTEFYYYLYYGWVQLYNQFEWLRKDLQEANKPENRQIRPWIIAMAHRPMYCSNNNDAMHCCNIDNTVRTGFPFSRNSSTGYILGLEDLFYNEGVDIIIAAHEHSYERFWPVYNLTGTRGSTIDSFSIVKHLHGRGLYNCHRNTQPQTLPMTRLQLALNSRNTELPIE
ncbi:Purple acid phosphatase [Fasciola hepatica]|uniref:Purple acid phosphatase n=1 Tax=Fasciola hepatica TaxID=6192 RepID=A0A4E0RB15_FASHE|nr:Purple acid phosphatase [Fasciola hepatica]